MKKRLFFIVFLIVCMNLSAQNSWEKQTAIADSLDLEMRFLESLSHRENALKFAKNQPDSIQKLLLGLRMLTQSKNDFRSGHKAYPEAYQLMKDAAETLKKVQANPERLSEVNNTLAITAYNYMHNPKDGQKHIDIALDYFNKTSKKDTLNLVKMMEFSGYMKVLSRDYDTAIQTFYKAIELLNQYNVKDDEFLKIKAKLYYDLSVVYNVEHLDIPLKEHQYIVESEGITSKIKELDPLHLIMIYRRFALIERDFGNFAKAKGYIQQAHILYEKHKDEVKNKTELKTELSLQSSSILISTGNNDIEGIRENLKKELEIVKNNRLDEVEKGLYKSFLNNLTTYYLMNYDVVTAEKYNEMATSISSNYNKALAYAHSLKANDLHTKINSLTLSYLKKEYESLLQMITEVEETMGEHNSKLIFELKAKSLLGLNQTLQANETIKQLLIAISEENNKFDFSKSPIKDFTPGYVISDTKILIRLAQAFQDHSKSNSHQVERLYWMALIQFENNIGNVPLNKDLKKDFDKIVSGLINAALQREFTTSENNRLLSFMEAVPSRNLIHKFLLKREIAENTQTYKIIEEEQFVRSYITYLKKEYQKSKDQTIKQQLFEKELQLKKINDKISEKYQKNNPFIAPKIDITTTNNKNIIKFKVANNQLFKIRWFKGKVYYDKIEDYPTLKQDIESYLTNINNLNIKIEELKKQGESLYNRLFTDDFNTTVPTVIIPDDVLYYLPFDILVKDGNFLIKNHTVSYASNFYFLNTKNFLESNVKSKKVVFFAPQYTGNVLEGLFTVRDKAYSLLGAEEEVSQIAKFIPGEVYVGSSASKSRFKSLRNDISILHLAMHSNLNDEDPELSHLVFSDAEQDFEMHISELYGLNFNADLAVLSACNTGVGGFKDGGNLVSMHHAFTTAGIPATVSSLWNAPDLSTKKIMVAFYKNLQKGQDKATALKQAKLDYLKNTNDENLQHPFYWAGFVLSGNETPVLLEEGVFWKNPIVYALVLVVLLVIILYFLNNKKKVSKNNNKISPYATNDF